MTSYKDDENSVPGEPQSPPHSFTPVVDGGASATLDNDLSSGGASDEPHDSTPGSPNFTKPSDTEDEEDSPEPPMKKRRQISSLPSDLNGASAASSPSPSTPAGETRGTPSSAKTASKSSNKSKKKKKKNNPWVKTASRKGKKKGKNNSGTPTSPAQRFPDKNVDDTPEARICLSKVYKADKVELSEDRMSAGSTKGYRMVRATRGVTEGAWYFEIKVVHLGSSGHTRLGWCTDEGDLQAPVGFDRNSFGYRDIDGSKVHKAVREKYGEEGYKEGDVIGFYINLSAPESEICFFKNGQCQGTAFSDLAGGRYFPAASMYTLPDQPNCTVKFNFGPDFEFFPGDFGGRVVPRPMVEVPFHGLDDVRAENEMNS